MGLDYLTSKARFNVKTQVILKILFLENTFLHAEKFGRALFLPFLPPCSASPMSMQSRSLDQLREVTAAASTDQEESSGGDNSRRSPTPRQGQFGRARGVPRDSRELLLRPRPIRKTDSFEVGALQREVFYRSSDKSCFWSFFFLLETSENLVCAYPLRIELNLKSV